MTMAEQQDGMTVDLSGYLLLPAAVEPHAHLDKAYLAERTGDVTGGLAAAVRAMEQVYVSIDAGDVRARAERALRRAVVRGYGAIRSHVDCSVRSGLVALETLVELKARYRSVVDLQLVALAGSPFTGTDGEGNRAVLRESLECGADVVGGVPAFDPDPRAAIELLAAEAEAWGRAIDLHLDETTDEHCMHLEAYAAAVERHRLQGRAVASHCVSLGQQRREIVDAVARRLVEAGIAVVTLPQTNLYLQGWGDDLRVPRALPPLRTLLGAGCLLAGGGDNWRDPFNAMGRIDPFEVASLLVTAGHLSVTEAYRAVSTDARRAIGLVAGSTEVGSPADLFAIRARSLHEALADASEARVVFKHGSLVAATSVTTTWTGPVDTASSSLRSAEAQA
jgi:cytosine deaminase